MYAEVTFNLEEKKNALIVPVAAIIPGDQPAVMLVDSSNRVEKRPVGLGISGSNQQEVTSGLSPGDRVVVGGTRTKSIREESDGTIFDSLLEKDSSANNIRV